MDYNPLNKLRTHQFILKIANLVNMEDGKALCENKMLTIEYKKNEVHLASNCMGVQGL